VTRSKGYRHRTRALFRKRPRDRGKVGLSRLMRERAAGERVMIKIEPSVHKGMPHKKYHGKVGVVEGRRGRSYILRLQLGKATKTLIVRPEHLA